MERNAKAQAQLVDELVDVSRIFTGKLAMDMSPIDLREVVEIVADASRPGAEDRSLEIAMDLPDQPVVVRGDSARLQQVVWNLVANAIKFTEPGGHVRIALRQRGGSAELAVDDDGAGIEASFLPHVFDRFRQADSTTTRSHRGLGLGLAIVREIVERHGGEVSATSAGKGLGSRFVVQVPLAGEVASSSPQPHLEASEGGPARGARRGGPVPQEAAAAPASSVTAGIASTSPAADGSDDGAPRPALDPCALAGLGVLLVEDDAGASEAVSMLLRHAGASVRTADSVREALSLLKDWRPRVIVSDIGLPFEDGYALIRKLRLLDGSAEERIPVVAMTAYAHAEERARVLAEGFDAHLVKPVDSAVLLSTLAKYVVSPDG
jgi:CheY-like chemotaxis protein